MPDNTPTTEFQPYIPIVPENQDPPRLCPVATAPDEPEPEADVWTCDNCGEIVESPSDLCTVAVRTGRNWGTQDWCEGCSDNDTIYVEDHRAGYPALPCSRVRTDDATDHLYYHESTDDWRPYAEETDEPEEEERDDGSLLEYGADVLRILGWPAQSPQYSNALLFGCELEMEAKSGYTANYLVERLGGSHGTKTGTAILKRDGSLEDGRGVELVTLPFTLDYHRSSGQWQAWLDSRLQAIAMSGAGTTNCGMHVHINRKAMSHLTIGKMVVFLNNPHNSGFVSTVAQRRSGGFCSRDERKKIHASYLGYSKLPAEDPETGDTVIHNSRYDIINISGNRTVEIRMFRGNLRPERVLKNIEFCHALVRFCEVSGVGDSALFGNFLEFLRKRRKDYPELCNFLAGKNYLPARAATGGNAPTLADI
jgi:hypothetical protein